MSSSNPPEASVKPTATPNDKIKTGRTIDRPCPYFRSSQGCYKGNECNWSHANPQTTAKAAQSDSSTPGEGSSSSTPDAPPLDEPKTERPPRSFGPGRGRGRGRPRGQGRPRLTQEQVKEQALAQSLAAKAENAKKVIVYSEDDEQSWSLDRELLSSQSKTMSLVLSFSRKAAADTGVRDPIKNTRGLLRFGEALENLQLDDVKADDFDTFLAGLRAGKDDEFTIEELQVILALASDWGFDDLRTRTIRDIEKRHQSPIDRAVLARRCKIARWIRGALLSLTILPDPLNATEIQLLGTTTAALIWRAREQVFVHRLQTLAAADRASPPQAKCTDASCKQTIRTALLGVLEKPGTAGKSESDLAALVENELAMPGTNKEGLCEACKSGSGLKDGVNDLVGDFNLAKIVMEVQLGKEGGKWLEPV